MAPSFQIRKSEDRGHADHGWLDTYHTFSFADYYSPKFTSFGSLRVLNEDTVQPSEGFGTHHHTEFEIFSYIVSGELRHRDSTGNNEVIKRGEIQFTTAGTGISHSEYNASETNPVHFLQIWNKPDNARLTPGYATGHYPDSCKKNRFALLIAPAVVRDSLPAPSDGADKPIAIHSDFWMSAGLIDQGAETVYTTPAAGEETPEGGRRLYLHVVRNNPKASVTVSSDGSAVSGVNLGQGDGVFVTGFNGTRNGLKVRNDGQGVAEVVLMDLA
ncbi:Pirin-domain-containing protein [Gonapodya prolifera JEL478]|uniref:Pirin-domain-containing protein n=1 Tax=Gonapodya prolifera (strain JEL478) TaxID=1344416 RepID=A0A139AX14_GONPJ|nr:Pirin-domain-containing protein [Gonapodya prolifera JEL478]|eukprot:KXS21015.1 Pirin-domain-containing protein [Gonapodya prolifera JEL478]